MGKLTEGEMVISNSRAKTWRRCPNQYRYKYVMDLQPKAKKVQLERGSWLHDLLMTHYDGHDWREVHEKWTKEFNSQFEETRMELGDLPNECKRIFLTYLRHYKEEDATYHTIDSEMDELIELPNGLKFRFIVDQIYEDSQGGLWLRDHKTIKKFYDTDFMVLDAQLTRYFWCAQKMGYTPLRGIEFNMLRTKAPAIPALLQSGQLTQRKNIDTDYWTYLATIKAHKLDPKPYLPILRRLRAQEEKFFRRDRLPQDPQMMRTMMRELVDTAQEIAEGEAENRYPRSPEQSCRWMCDFKDICVTELQGGDAKSVIKHGFVKRKREEE